MLCLVSTVFWKTNVISKTSQKRTRQKTAKREPKTVTPYKTETKNKIGALYKVSVTLLFELSLLFVTFCRSEKCIGSSLSSWSQFKGWEMEFLPNYRCDIKVTRQMLHDIWALLCSCTLHCKANEVRRKDPSV